MKTVTLGWLLRKRPQVSLMYSSGKYQYYFCPEREFPYTFVGGGQVVKIKRAYVEQYLDRRYEEQ